MLLATYVLALAVSHVVRWSRPGSDPLGPGQSSVALQAVDGDRLLARTVRLVYEDHAPAVETDSCVVLLHGSPGNKENFAGLVTVLAQRHLVIAPDMPGVGASTADVPD